MYFKNNYQNPLENLKLYLNHKYKIFNLYYYYEIYFNKHEFYKFNINVNMNMSAPINDINFFLKKTI